jgi:serine/threonine protein kinase
MGGASSFSVVCPGCGEPAAGRRCVQCGSASEVGGYRVEQVIAATDHARVYAAVGPDGQKVALKELLFARAPSNAELAAFDREAELLGQLNHPAIPKYLGRLAEGQGAGARLYLIQEFIEGESLLAQCRRGPMSEAKTRSIAQQVLEILQYLHGLSPKVIHRDIKPANLVQRPDGSIALIDFGASRDLRADETPGSSFIGTFGYMPPEQMGGKVTTKSDLYALGATLLHLLTGKPPGELLGDGFEFDFARHISVSAEFGLFLGRLVAFRQDGRFGSVAEALEALSARPRLISKRSRTGWGLGAGGLLASLLTATLLAHFWRRPAPPPPPAPPHAPPPAPPPPPVVLSPAATELALPLDVAVFARQGKPRPHFVGLAPEDWAKPACAAPSRYLLTRWDYRVRPRKPAPNKPSSAVLTVSRAFESAGACFIPSGGVSLIDGAGHEYRADVVESLSGPVKKPRVKASRIQFPGAVRKGTLVFRSPTAVLAAYAIDFDELVLKPAPPPAP